MGMGVGMGMGMGMGIGMGMGMGGGGGGGGEGGSPPGFVGSTGSSSPVAAASPVVQAAPVAAVKFCPFCGNKLQAGHKFCGNCGEKIPQVGTSPAPSTVQNTNSKLSQHLSPGLASTSNMSLEPLLPLPPTMPAHAANLQNSMFSQSHMGMGLGGLTSSSSQERGGGVGVDFDFMSRLSGDSMRTTDMPDLGGLSMHGSNSNSGNNNSSLQLGGLGSLGGGQWDTFGTSPLSPNLGGGGGAGSGLQPQNSNKGPPAQQQQGRNDEAEVDLNSIMGSFRSSTWN